MDGEKVQEASWSEVESKIQAQEHLEDEHIFRA